MGCRKGSNRSTALFNSHLVIPTEKIQFCEDLHPMHSVHAVRYHIHWKPFFHCHIIHFTVVYTDPKRAIWLANWNNRAVPSGCRLLNHSDLFQTITLLLNLRDYWRRKVTGTLVNRVTIY